MELQRFLDDFFAPTPTESARPLLRAMLSARSGSQEVERGHSTAPAPNVRPGPADSSQPPTNPPRAYVGVSQNPTLPDDGTSASLPGANTAARVFQSSSANSEVIETREFTPGMYAARTTAIIAQETAKREIAAEQAIEAATTARLRHARAKRDADSAEQEASRGELFRKCARSTREACDRAREEADLAGQIERQAIAEWRRGMRELGEAAQCCLIE